MTSRLRSANMELKDRVKLLRQELGLTQEQLAALTIPEGETDPVLKREEISKIEQGDLKGQSARQRDGLAAAFGLRLEDARAFFDGRITPAEAKRRRVTKNGTQLHNGDLAGWIAAEAKARALAATSGQSLLEGYHFMGARMLPLTLRPAVGDPDVMWVTGWAWIFQGSAEPEDVERAKKAETAERARSSKVPPSTRK